MAENKKITDEAEESLKLMNKTYGGYKKTFTTGSGTAARKNIEIWKNMMYNIYISLRRLHYAY